MNQILPYAFCKIKFYYISLEEILTIGINNEIIDKSN